MKSYEKLKAKVELYESLIDNMKSELRNLMEKPEDYLTDSVSLPTLDKEAIKDCCRLILHDIYEHEELIWKLK